MSAVDVRAERRADRAAEADERRRDAVAADERAAARRREADERAARERARTREENTQADVERRRRRAERAVRRAGALTPEHVYRRGTLALVAASGLASLPAQVLHFVHISPMLLPLPFAVEGAAWVLAAGVAFAHARHLPVWVCWTLRVLVLTAAGFAASINYDYGLSLENLSAGEARTAGIGLAAVTLLGPVLFEIRQWVGTLAAIGDGEDGRVVRARRRHRRTRRRHHRPVARIADRLLSAAPHGALTAEDAWAKAWRIHTGTDDHGMTPDLHRRAVESAAAMARAQQPIAAPTHNREESGQQPMYRSMSDLPVSGPVAFTIDRVTGPARIGVDCMKPHPIHKPIRAIEPGPTGTVHRVTPGGPHLDLFTEQTPTDAPVLPAAVPDRSGTDPVRVAAADAPRRPRRVTGRVPVAARPPAQPRRTAAEVLTAARELTADWTDTDLSAERLRKMLRTSPARAREIRDTLRAERARGPVPS
ncbi:hypothetical protein ABT354_05550 [Streptomyces sp. NPDC000594]|uniref:hypothetical protein n=1 Tax=Streptomyces sp. NPDC000594 TaxID=3154261 RepID=UPI00332FDA0A